MRQRILNNRAQPVELHLTAGVVVIPPSGEVEVDVDEGGERHLDQLAADLRIAILPVAEESGENAEDAENAGPHHAESKKTAAKRKR